MRRNIRRSLLLATPILTLGLVALALHAGEADSPSEAPRFQIAQEAPGGPVTLVQPPGLQQTGPQQPGLQPLGLQSSRDRSQLLDRLSNRERSQQILQRLDVRVPSVDQRLEARLPTPCVAQSAGLGAPDDPCGVGAEIAGMTPCLADDPETCEAYRAWSEHFGAPTPQPAPVERLGPESATDKP